jgi:O-antigen/teichoic acid export membrane protein
MVKNSTERLKRAFPRLFENELIRRVVLNSGYLFSATGISAALSMLQSILAARLLGVTEFGILGTITVFVTVVNKFASFRMSEL